LSISVLKTSAAFVHDGIAGTTERVSNAVGGGQADLDSLVPSMSDDGRYVAFVSFATNLLQQPDANGPLRDAFVRDRATSTTTLVSRSGVGIQENFETFGAEIGGDGRYVAFASTADNLVQGDTNDEEDVFRHDRMTGATVRVSVSTFLVEADGSSSNPSISDDGDVIAFESAATHLAPDTNGKVDIYTRKMTCNGNLCFPPTSRVSVTATGGQTNGDSSRPDLSDSGAYVAFASSATNMVPGDSNGFLDVFVRDRTHGRTARVDTALFLAQAVGGGSENASISGDGRTVAFQSDATNLVDGDTNGVTDVFLRAQPVSAVLSLSPSTHPADGSPFAVTITGSNFLPGAQIRFAGSAITASVNAISDTTISATFTISVGTPSGAVDVYVANPGTGPGTTFGTTGSCAGCLTVT